MGNRSAEATAAFFDTKKYKYEIFGEDGDIILFNMLMDNREPIKVALIFSKDGTSVSIRNTDLARVPEGKELQAIRVCNELNLNFRWIKFAYDDERKMIQASDDAVIYTETCGEEVYRCCGQLMDIADEAYPLIMKALYV
jgi:hypothetical protein